MDQKTGYRTKLVVLVFLLLLLVTIGTFTYHHLEGWNYVDAAYFSTVTMTTIGYGDMHPTHEVSKIFTIFFIFAGVGTFLFSIGVIGEHYFNRRVEFVERAVEKFSSQAQRAMGFGNVEKQDPLAARRNHMRDMKIDHKFKPAQDNGFKQGVKFGKN
jgi:hypothetical protein